MDPVVEMTEREWLIAQLRAADRATSIAHVVADLFTELADPLSQLIGNVEFALEQLESVAPSGAVLDCVEALCEARSGGDVLREAALRIRTYLRAGEERQEVEVAAALRAAVAVTDAELRGRASVRVELGPLPRVRGSETGLRQVFAHLLANAAEAIPAGHPDRHRVTVTGQLGADGRVVVEVSDTGSGIAPEHRARIFEPFFTTRGDGRGFGLAACRCVVKAMGGTIEVGGEPGQGTTIRVLLPAAEAVVVGPPAVTPTPSGGGPLATPVPARTPVPRRAFAPTRTPIPARTPVPSRGAHRRKGGEGA